MASIRTACLGLRWSSSRPVLRSPILSVGKRPFLQPQQHQLQRRTFQSQRPRQRQQYNRFTQARDTSIYLWERYPKWVLGGTGTLGAVWYYNHDEVPVTNRWRFNIVSAEVERSYGESEYKSELQEFRNQILPEYHPSTRRVRRVVERLLPASGIANEGNWTVTVVDDKDNVNAFVIPGGHVFVFTGILDLAQNDDALAAVLSHEIAHNVAHHAAERMSRFLPMLITAIGIALLVDTSLQFSQYIVNLVLELPGSRKLEAEADHIGLLMMAKSCYDPEEAVRLWGRMQEVEKRKGGAIPQFLSTHPSSKHRAERIASIIPEARQLQEQSNCHRTLDFLENFRSSVSKSEQAPSGRSGGKDILDDWFG